MESVKCAYLSPSLSYLSVLLFLFTTALAQKPVRVEFGAGLFVEPDKHFRVKSVQSELISRIEVPIRAEVVKTLPDGAVYYTALNEQKSLILFHCLPGQERTFQTVKNGGLNMELRRSDYQVYQAGRSNSFLVADGFHYKFDIEQAKVEFAKPEFSPLKNRQEIFLPRSDLFWYLDREQNEIVKRDLDNPEAMLKTIKSEEKFWGDLCIKNPDQKNQLKIFDLASEDLIDIDTSWFEGVPEDAVFEFPRILRVGKNAFISQNYRHGFGKNSSVFIKIRPDGRHSSSIVPQIRGIRAWKTKNQLQNSESVFLATCGTNNDDLLAIDPETGAIVAYEFITTKPKFLSSINSSSFVKLSENSYLFAWAAHRILKVERVTFEEDH